MIDTDIQKIDEILTRGVEDVFIEKDLREKLLSGKQLRIKFGIDPTSPFIHLGRAVTLRKLKAFQDLGHHIVLIIGDYTAKIGDPSDKLEKRPMLTDEDIQNNLKNYLDQIGLILNLDSVEVRYNSEWLKTMNFFEIGQLLECFTVQQMTKRRNFKERLDAGGDIFMVEFMYPALQGYDSLMVNADVEIGGFDQLFNLKAGRIVQRRYGKKEQDVLTNIMLEGTDGRKMSSSWGNIIGITDEPDVMFGKIMALKDDLILKYFLLATDKKIKEIDEIKKQIEKGENPMKFKKILGIEIVTLYHNKDKAFDAQKNWEDTFSNKEIPQDVEHTFKFDENKTLMDTVIESGLVSSKTEYRRLLDAGAIEHMEDKKEIKNDTEAGLIGTYRIGKKRFIRIKS